MVNKIKTRLEQQTDMDAERETDRQRRKEIFIAELARFLCENQAAKSISLEYEKRSGCGGGSVKFAHEWATLRSKTPLFGYLDENEAAKILREFLQ